MTLGSPPPHDPAATDAGLSHDAAPVVDETALFAPEAAIVANKRETPEDETDSEGDDAEEIAGIEAVVSASGEPSIFQNPRATKILEDDEAEAHDSIRSDVPWAHRIPPPEPDAEGEIEYEDDETSGTLALRALFTLLAGGFLLWTEWWNPVNASEQWGTWVKGAALANFVMPLGIVWLFFGQGLRTPEWMRDPRHNAWAYGWNPRPFKQHLGFALICLVVMLPFLWYFSKIPGVRESYYEKFLPPTQTLENFARVMIGLAIYMLCWEWFFRGFLLFGLAQGLGKWGWIVAIVLQAALFCCAHIGKPPLEMQSSFFGGLILGYVCWRTKSFFPAFYTHLLIHVAWVLLIR